MYHKNHFLNIQQTVNDKSSWRIYLIIPWPICIHRNHFLNIQAEGFLPVSFFPFLFLSSKGNNGGPDAVYQADKTIISHAIPPPDLETITYWPTIYLYSQAVCYLLLLCREQQHKWRCWKTKPLGDIIVRDPDSFLPAIRKIHQR